MIETKLTIPYMKGLIMARPHLHKKLYQGLYHKLTLITSPAGYGKSILLSKWASEINLPIAWVSLDPEDNNILRFWANMIESLQQFNTEDGAQTALNFITPNSDSHTFFAMFMNQLHRHPLNVVVVLDNFHTITNPLIIDGVNDLLERLPTHVHLYISGRKKPPLPLSRLRMEDHLIEIEVEDLQLNEAESMIFLKECTNLKLTGDESRKIYERSEGWIAGIKLIALVLREGMKQGNEVLDILNTMIGKSVGLSDYFLEEVLNKLPKEHQDFLLETSILNQMNAALCEEITCLPNGLYMLQRLESENVFLVPLDSKQHWFRYHPMFQEFLKAQLKLRKPEKFNQLHIVAGRWLVKNGYSEEALSHYLVGEDYEEVFQLLHKVIPSLSGYEKVHLYEWLNDIPNYLLFKRPMLFITNIASLFLSGYREVATKKYWWAMNELEQFPQDFTDSEIVEFKAGLDLLMAYRTFLEGDLESFVIYSKKYVENKLDSNFLVNLGTDRSGYHSIWDIYLSEGDLEKAEEMLPVLMDIWSQTRNKPFYVHLCTDYAKFLYEKNRLDDALYYAREAVALAKELENVSLYVKVSLAMVEINISQKRFDMADLRMETLNEYLKKHNYISFTKDVEQMRVKIALLRGQKEIVYDWLENSNLCSTDEIPLSMLKTYYLLARSFIMQGKSDKAIVIYNKLLYLAEDHGKHQEVIRYTIGKSYIYMKENEKNKSNQFFEDALLLASKGGYIRVFLDLGAECEQLLVQYIQFVQDNFSSLTVPDSTMYAEQLIGMIAQHKGEKVCEEFKNPLLTEREVVVLQFIQEGLSNKAIADELDISLATVKTHINNMYRKLGVNNRVLALNKAVEMRLL